MAKSQTSFKPGQSGNPKGAPKKEWTMRAVYIEAMEEVQKNGEPVNKIIARVLVREGLKGNILAIKELNNRIDGLPLQDVRMQGEVNISFHESLKQTNE